MLHIYDVIAFKGWISSDDMLRLLKVMTQEELADAMLRFGRMRHPFTIFGNGEDRGWPLEYVSPDKFPDILKGVDISGCEVISLAYTYSPEFLPGHFDWKKIETENLTAIDTSKVIDETIYGGMLKEEFKEMKRFTEDVREKMLKRPKLEFFTEKVEQNG